jgi:hypothetical protein
MCSRIPAYGSLCKALTLTKCHGAKTCKSFWAFFCVAGLYDCTLPTAGTLLQWLSEQYKFWKIGGFRPGRKRRSRESTARSTAQGVKKCLERLGKNNQLAPLRTLLDVTHMQTLAESIGSNCTAGHAASQVCHSSLPHACWSNSYSCRVSCVWHEADRQI